MSSGVAGAIGVSRRPRRCESWRNGGDGVRSDARRVTYHGGHDESVGIVYEAGDNSDHELLREPGGLGRT